MRLSQFTLLLSASLIMWIASSALCRAAIYVMDKEIARQDAEQKDRCDKYAAEINAHAGREVCPPTPNG